MVDERKRSSYPGEKVLFETRPRFVTELTSTLLKLLIIILLAFFFQTMLSTAAVIQNYLVGYIRLPLVEGVSYFLLILILVLFLWTLWDLFSWRSHKYLLTDRRVMIKKGMIRKKTVYIHFNKIQDISISQSLFGRLFQSGDIKIFGGHEHTQMLLENIPNPVEVDDMINRLIDGEEIGFQKYKGPSAKKSIVREYDKKFKRY
jgi:membrane protein YdbS with pleckstrin-like domain